MSEPVGQDYELLDSGAQMKLERLGTVLFASPCRQAIWRRRLPPAEWRKAAAPPGRNPAHDKRPESEPVPERWEVSLEGLKFAFAARVGRRRDFLPELAPHWRRVRERAAALSSKQMRPARVLNVFGGAGVLTLAAAAGGAEVWHVAESADQIAIAREAAALNGLSGKPIHWVVDQPSKFLEREKRGGHRFDLIVLDPPCDQRPDARGGFRLEQHLPAMLDLVSNLLSATPAGILISCRAAALSPLALQHLARQTFSIVCGRYEAGERVLAGGEGVAAIPCGSWAWWVKD